MAADHIFEDIRTLNVQKSIQRLLSFVAWAHNILFWQKLNVCLFYIANYLKSNV